MSPDPLGLEGGTRPQGYVDNPSASIDPWGLEHLNFNGATGNFGVYEIYMDGEVYKIGKADLNRITQSSDLPTRLHQQIVKLRKLYPNKKVTGDVVERGFKTTAEAKAAETARLDRYYKKTNGGIPKGNTKSYKPYSKKGR